MEVKTYSESEKKEILSNVDHPLNKSNLNSIQTISISGIKELYKIITNQEKQGLNTPFVFKKILNLDPDIDEKLQNHEVKVHNILRHLNICTELKSQGKYKDSAQKEYLYIIFEYYEQSLKSIFDNRIQSKWGQQLEKCINYIIGLVYILELLQQKGYVHLCIRPSCIFIGKNSNVILGDMSCLWKREKLKVNNCLIIGNIAYTAPEICEHISNSTIFQTQNLYCATAYSVAKICLQLLTTSDEITMLNLMSDTDVEKFMCKFAFDDNKNYAKFVILVKALLSENPLERYDFISFKILLNEMNNLSKEELIKRIEEEIYQSQNRHAEKESNYKDTKSQKGSSESNSPNSQNLQKSLVFAQYVPYTKKIVLIESLNNKYFKFSVDVKEMDDLFFENGKSLVFNNKNIFIIGGYNKTSQVFSNAVYVLTYPNDKIAKRSPMKQRRSEFGITLFTPYIIVCGGFLDWMFIKSCEQYHIENDVWIEMPPFKSAKVNPSLCVVQNQFLYSFGGRFESKGNSSPQKNVAITNSLERLILFRTGIVEWEEIQLKFEFEEPLSFVYGSSSVPINKHDILVFGGKLENLLNNENTFIIYPKEKKAIKNGLVGFQNHIESPPSIINDNIYVLGRQGANEENIKYYIGIKEISNKEWKWIPVS